MDLKRVQEQLRNDILHHQALMEMRKKNPTDQALALKLKAIQRHITELGAQQKRILFAPRGAQPQENRLGSSTTRGDGAQTRNISSTTASMQSQVKLEPTTTGPQFHHGKQASHTTETPNSAYTLITIKNGPQTNITPTSQPTNNVPINLSRLAAGSSVANQPFTTTSALLVVSTSNQVTVRPAVLPQKTTSVPISLASLVSTGGVVTLPGGWKGTPQPSMSNNTATIDTMGRILPTKQVQIKLPVVQSPGSNPVILMPQKSPVSQAKSLFRLLPKGCHPIPVNSTPGTIVSGSSRAVGPTSQISINKQSPVISNNPIPTILMPSDVSKSQSVQQILVQRVGNLTTVAAPTSVTWQDLSSKTPAIHKPSYVPRKTFPNLNNGVGSFQKFRILDGKAQILPKTPQESITGAATGPFAQGCLDKPRNAALKAVLTSSKAVENQTGAVTLARLVPASIPQNGFFPIQRQDSASSGPSSSKLPLYPQLSNDSPFIPVAVTTASTSSFRPISASGDMSSSASGTGRQTPVLDEQTKAKMTFLRNIDLIPKEQAVKVRGRRFRKRRNAANPVYSGGMYISNEFEPKKQCPGLMANAIESITAPDVIVKRPRGRPRGSRNAASPALRLQSSTRGPRVSPSLPSNVEDLRKVRGILDSVASKATSATASTPVKEQQLLKPTSPHEISFGAKLTEAAKMASGGDESIKPRSKSEENGDEHEDQCAVCGKTGEVLMCDTCSRVYHLSCSNPPLATVPQGMWVCSKCKTEFKDTRPKVEWSGIVSAVHSYMEHDKNRDKDIETQSAKLAESKKIVAALQAQIKTLNSVVLTKASSRSKVLKERQMLQKGVEDMNTLVQRVWSLITRGGGGSTVN